MYLYESIVKFTQRNSETRHVLNVAENQYFFVMVMINMKDSDNYETLSKSESALVQIGNVLLNVNRVNDILM